MFLQIGLSIALVMIFVLVEDEFKNSAKKRCQSPQTSKDINTELRSLSIMVSHSCCKYFCIKYSSHIIKLLSTNKLSKSFMRFWAFLSLTLSNYGIHYFGSLDHNISFHMITDDCRQTIDRTDSIPAIMIEDDRGTVFPFDQGQLLCIIRFKEIRQNQYFWQTTKGN